MMDSLIYSPFYILKLNTVPFAKACNNNWFIPKGFYNIIHHALWHYDVMGFTIFIYQFKRRN